MQPDHAAQELRDGHQSVQPKAISLGKRYVTDPHSVKVTPDMGNGGVLVRIRRKEYNIETSYCAPINREVTLKTIKH